MRLVAAVGVLLFLLWATRGHSWTPFTAFFPTFHLIYIAALLIFVWLEHFHRTTLAAAWGILVRRRFLIFPSLAFLVPLGIALFFFNETAHPFDAAHYLWTARLFLSGRLFLPLPPFYEHLSEGFMVIHDDRIFSLFPPGFPAILAPFAAIDLTFWLNPILNGFAVFLTGRLAERLTGDVRVATLAMIFTTVSAFHLFLAAMLFPHHIVLVLTLMAILIAETGRLTPMRAAIIGLCVALIVPTRPQDGLFTATAILLFLCIRHGRPSLVTILSFGVPIIGGAVLYLAYQRALTGDWFTYPQDLFFAVIEENRECHHIGLGTGCRRFSRFILPPEGLTLTHGFFVTMTRLSEMLFKTTLHPIVWFFLVPALWSKARRHAAAILLFFAFVGGYYLFHQDGNFYGPRYYCTVGPLLLIAAAEGMIVAVEHVGIWGRRLMAALVGAGILFTSVVIIPEIALRQDRRWYTAVERVQSIVAARDIHDSIIFLPFRAAGVYRFANTLVLQKKPPHDTRGNRYLNSIPLLDEHTAAFFIAQGYRQAWRIDEDSFGEFSLAPVEPSSSPVVVIEAEYKLKPLSGRALSGFIVSNFVDEEEFVGFVTPLSGYFGYGIRFGPAGDGIGWDIEHYVVDTARYRLVVEVAATPCGGETEFLIDGVSYGSFPAGADPQRSVHFVVEADLVAGPHHFMLVPREDNRCLVIDRIVATPVGASSDMGGNNLAERYPGEKIAR